MAYAVVCYSKYSHNDNDTQGPQPRTVTQLIQCTTSMVWPSGSLIMVP